MSGVTHCMGVFKELTVALGSASDEGVRVHLTVEAATSMVERCSRAGFTVNDKGGLSTGASSDIGVRRANELQQELGEGPCLDVRRDQDTLVSRHLADERRWPRWAPRVHDELRVGSLISVLVCTEARSYGALSLYTRRGVQFDEDDTAVAQVLAGQMAVMITWGREIDQLRRAVHGRTITGQAQGVLMERLDIDSARAFDYMRRISSHSNRKVVEIATEIAGTRTLPGVPSAFRS
jgi:signal transduction protein with GAF and PtsI domain